MQNLITTAQVRANRNSSNLGIVQCLNHADILDWEITDDSCIPRGIILLRGEPSPDKVRGIFLTPEEFGQFIKELQDIQQYMQPQETK